MLRYTINHPWSQRNCWTFVTRAAIETTGQIQIQLHWIAIVNVAVAVLCRSSLSIRRHFPFFVSTTILIARYENQSEVGIEFSHACGSNEISDPDQQRLYTFWTIYGLGHHHFGRIHYDVARGLILETHLRYWKLGRDIAIITSKSTLSTHSTALRTVFLRPTDLAIQQMTDQLIVRILFVDQIFYLHD